MNDWDNLPLFPLDTVLFPGMVLPLHIFEERYKLMIGRCLKAKRPFGVVLAREDGSAASYDVGTTAVIAGASRMADGRYNLITIGSERFRLCAVRDDQPYLIGAAEPWPLSGTAPQEWVRSALASFEHYLSLLNEVEGHKIEIEQIPDEPRALALLLAITLQVPWPEKQSLLCRPSVADLLQAERSILKRERLILGYISRTQSKQREGGQSGYLAEN